MTTHLPEPLSVRRVGLVGLGNVGGRMMRSLLLAGVDLNVFDTNPDLLAEARTAGANPVESANVLAGTTDVLVLSLPSSDVVESVLFSGGAPLVDVLTPGSVVVDMSTCLPHRTLDAARRLADRDVHLVDAPITFGPRGMVVFVGGAEQTGIDLSWLFDAVAFRHHHVGPVGHGHQVKLLQNFLSGVSIGAVAEAVGLAERIGLDLTVLQESLRWTGAHSPALAGAQRMAARDYGTTRTLAMHVKDLGYALETGERVDAVQPYARLTHEVFANVLGAGDPAWTQSAVIEAFTKPPTGSGQGL